MGSGYQAAILAELSAAAYTVEKISESLVDQMAPGGRMVIPVGDRSSQVLLKVQRTAEGLCETRLGGCRFFALKGAHGW